MAESSHPSGQCIIVMRHGARLDTADPSWERTLGVDRPYDTPLTGKGKIEAYHIATKQFRDKNITKVISSPMLRCLQTAQAVCNAISIPGLITCNGLCELLTPGAKMTSTPQVPIKDLSPYGINIIQYDERPIPEFPETLNQSLQRYNEVISQIADEYYPDNLLLVTHQYGVEEALLLALDKKEAMNYEVSYCGNVVLKRENKDDVWKLLSMSRVDKYDVLID